MLASPSSPSDSRWKVLAAFWIAALFWGTSFLWIKIGLEKWNPVSLVAFRLLVASLLFGIVLNLTGQSVRVRRSDWPVLIIVALFNPYIPFLLISWAELRIDTGMTSVLNATVPLFTLVLTPFLLPAEKPGWRTLLGVLLGFIGIGVLFGEQATLGSGQGLLGQLAVVLASILYAFATVLLRRYTLQASPLAQAALLNAIACVFVWIHGGVSGTLTLPPMGSSWLAVLWLGTLGSFAAYSLAMYVLSKRGATQMAMINFAYPLLALLLGVLFLNELFSWRLVVGAILILSGIVLVQKRKTTQ